MRLLPLALILAAAPAVAGSPARYGVRDAALKGVDPKVGEIVTLTLANCMSDAGAVVITGEDTRALLQHEVLRQVAGHDDANAAEVAQNLTKVERLVVPAVARIGRAWVASVALFDDRGNALRRASFEAYDEGRLLDASCDLGHRLVTGADRPMKQPRVAVLYFNDNSKKEELAPLSKGLADMLVGDLERAQGVRVVERDRIEEVLAELKLQSSKAFDPATSAKVGKLVGAEYLVLGSYFEMAGSLRLDARVVKVETGVVTKSAGVTGKRDDFFDLERKLADALAEGLGTKLATPDDPPVAKFEDALVYAKAVQQVDAGDRAAAAAALEAVAKKSPTLLAARRLAARHGL